MAKKSMIQRELKRERLQKKYAGKRAKLKAIIACSKSNDEMRWQAQVDLQKLPVNSSLVRRQRRCNLTGRPHAVYRKFGLSRNMLRLYAMQGYVPGVKKASW